MLAANILAAQTAYVAAPSGLKLRKTAGTKATIVKTLPYASKIEYVADSKPKVEHKTKEAEGLYLKGFWQKVVAGNDTGYVFDAFLLPFEPVTEAMQKKFNNQYETDCKPEEYLYFESVFKKSGGVYDIVKVDSAYSEYFSSHKNPASPFCNESFKQKFINGIVFEYSHVPEKNMGLTVTFTGYNFNVVYALVLSYTALQNACTNCAPITIEYKNKAVEISPDGAGCWSTIVVKGKTIIWDMSCGC